MTVVKFNTKTAHKETAESDGHIDRGVKTVNAVKVDKVDTDLFMAKEIWFLDNSVGSFGGQVVAQALHAGFQTFPEDFSAHSLHCYFILTITGDHSLFFKVDRVRDGRSYATRSITATQGGKNAFVASCSFAKSDKSFHLDHQIKMRDVNTPESIPSEIDLIYSRLEHTGHSKEVREKLESLKVLTEIKMDEHLPIEFRYTMDYTDEEYAAGDVDKPNPQDGRWFRTYGNPGDDLRIHACLIAFGSDWEFLNIALKANGTTYRSERVGMMSSLDHSMWFHEPTRADQWLLHDTFSPRSKNGRAVSFGKIYTRDGELIATTAQEGVVRLSKAEQERRMKQAQLEKNIKIIYGENNRL